MKLDKLCNEVYLVAVNEAKIKKHKYITPEHFIYAMLMFEEGKELIEKNCGETENIKINLTTHLKNSLKNIANELPKESDDFVKLMELSTNRAIESNKENIYLIDILLSLFFLENSYVKYILIKSGITKYSVLKTAASLKIIEQDKEEMLKKRAELRAKKDLEFISKYTVNMIELAKNDEYDELIGRDEILKRTIQILLRRTKSNPIHVGEPGVGKTSIVEGLAKRIASDKVPELLKNSNLFYLDLGRVIAGTKYRGDFEDRLNQILKIISKLEKPIIYIDEIHILVGAGAANGSSMDATNIIKPILTKGIIKFMGSTTFDEFKKHFEKDKALSRRFQDINVNEPTLNECIEILNGIKNKYEMFHNVIYSEDIIKYACELSIKYINNKFLPDKAIDVIDETGSFVRMNSNKNKTVKITRLEIERTISNLAKIPLKTVSEKELSKLFNLSKNIKKDIFGQDEAVEIIVNSIKLAKTAMNNENKPICSLLFVGSTGVGKTELAFSLSKNLGININRFDMSEYQEKHSISKLIGTPPGYVGYEEGGFLSDIIRKEPYSIILLDEIEKAHKDIYNILLQIMDYGRVTDNFGESADFRNAIIIMTSNAGVSESHKNIVGYAGKLNDENIDKEIKNTFSVEFRNRLDNIIKFKNFNQNVAVDITNKLLLELKNKLKKNKINLKITNQVVEYIAAKSLESLYGAREIARIIDKEIKKELIDEMLFGKLVDGGDIKITLINEKLDIVIKKDLK